MLICAVGDLLMDVVARPDDHWRGGDDVGARVACGAGGQAANVAAWAVHLGASARLIAARASDIAGDLVARDLADRGVDLRGPLLPGRTGTVVSLVASDGERAMLSDRGVSPGFAPQDLELAWLTGVDRLHVTGYALLAEPLCDTALAAVDHARRAGARVSVDLSAAHRIRAVGGDVLRGRLDLVSPDVVFGTADEFAALDGEVTAAVIVTKRGARGCTVDWAGGRERVAAPDVAVVDATGAGDAFAAGFLVAATLREAVDGARSAAAACLGTMGSMPPRTPSSR